MMEGATPGWMDKGQNVLFFTHFMFISLNKAEQMERSRISWERERGSEKGLLPLICVEQSTEKTNGVRLTLIMVTGARYSKFTRGLALGCPKE